MDTSKYMDKQITELSQSQSLNFLGDDDKQEVKDGDHGFEFNTVCSLSQSHNKYLAGTSLTGWSSMDRIDSAKFSAEKVGASSNAALISEIDKKMKAHVDILLHSVECLNARVSQLESKTHQIEDVVDDIKESLELNQGKTDGKLREMKNILVEVQGGVQDLRDKQEIAEAQLQLAKLQMSKNNQQVEKQNVTGQAYEAPSLVSQQSHQLLPVPAPATPVATAPQLPTQLLQNQTTAPSVPKQEPYNPLVVPTPDSTYQQYQVPPAQQSQPIPYNHLPCQPMPHFPQNSQLPQLPQVHPDSSMVNPQAHYPSSLHTEVPYSPPHSISQPPGRSPTLQQYNAGSTQQIYPQPPNRHYVESTLASLPAHAKTNIMDSYHYGASPCNNGISSIKPSQPIPSPPVLTGESIYKQLPTARLLPNAIPSASNVDAGSGSGSGGSGNRIPVDDFVDRVATMGFHRDLVRATVRKLMENGQSVDLNTVLDKLMNG
ncbi:PREDICTED: arginine-glutamic acid dipeptide repeats protein-like isoform X2 [Populus euphratica]|uniref:Arginine-glutamic acid dipeptide repeats protein-like isoform X2 n=1 Tax=Populus euphratica TaxID=75702 RepID=A0AAJ6VG68_POPEU|nr:PREDICTED: arginine-glutamic acid dipeptide repeats protein-like isoform X2 [Populus euphratica]